ncbi:MAG: hypothetical protein ABIE70_06235 [bacterium]
MSKHVIFVLGLALLYLIPALALQAVYGPSYGFMAGEDCWQPDGQGGWVEHGAPSDPAPDQSSVVIPIGLLYLPIFLPAGLLILFMFTPLSRKLERRRPDDELGSETDASGSDPVDTSDSKDD